MKKRKFGDGGMLDDLAEGKASGRFDKDTYSRAKAWMEKQDKEAPEKKSSKPSPSKDSTSPSSASSAAKASPKADSAEKWTPSKVTPEGRAEIPTGGMPAAPKESGRIPGEVERNLVGIAMGAGPTVGHLTKAGVNLAAARAMKAPAASAARDVAVREASETPLSFLGRSGARNITPQGRISTPNKLRLEGPAEKAGARLERPSPLKSGSARAELERAQEPLRLTKRGGGRGSPAKVSRAAREEEEAIARMRDEGGMGGFAKGGSVEPVVGSKSPLPGGSKQQGGNFLVKKEETPKESKGVDFFNPKAVNAKREKEVGLSKGGSVRGAGLARKGWGCGGKVR